jgi:hypothetical protein
VGIGTTGNGTGQLIVMGGNVGIGTISPQANLQVAGNIEIGTNANLDYLTVNSGATGGVTINSNSTSMTITSATVSANIVANVGSLGGINNISGQTFTLANTTSITGLSIGFTSNVGSPSGTATVTITTSPGGSLANANATTTFTPSPSSLNTFNFPTAFSLIPGTYYIQIASTSAQSNGVYWQLNGNTSSSYPGNLIYYNGTWQSSASTALYFYVYGITTTPTLTFASAGSTSAQITSANNLSLIDNGVTALSINGLGNVGVGSTNPGKTLDVNGTARATNMVVTGVTALSMVYTNGNQQLAPVTLTATGTSGPSTFSGGTLNIPQYGGGSGSNYWNLATGGNIGISTISGVGIGTTFGNAGLTVMNGNVGIGTWLPVNSLDVNGSAALGTYAGVYSSPSAGGLIISGNLGIGTWSFNRALVTNGAIQIGSNINNFISTTSANFDQGLGTLNARSVSDSNSNLDMTWQSGNVGIGTAGLASATLEVVQKTGNPPLMISSGIGVHGDYLEMVNGGNVGIGSLTPGSLLDVQGTVRATGFTVGAGNIIGPNGGVVNIIPLVFTNSTTPGTAIPTGSGSPVQAVASGKIISVTSIGSNNGGVCSSSGDIWKANAALPTVTNTITASDLPTLSSATYAQDTTLTGWTTSVSKNDVFMANVISTTCDKLTIELAVSS